MTITVKNRPARRERRLWTCSVFFPPVLSYFHSGFQRSIMYYFSFECKLSILSIQLCSVEASFLQMKGQAECLHWRTHILSTLHQTLKVWFLRLSSSMSPFSVSPFLLQWPIRALGCAVRRDGIWTWDCDRVLAELQCRCSTQPRDCRLTFIINGLKRSTHSESWIPSLCVSRVTLTVW